MASQTEKITQTTPAANENVANEQEFMTSNWNETAETFESMGLKEELLRGIFSYGYEKPSLVQQRCIIPLLTYVIS